MKTIEVNSLQGLLETLAKISQQAAGPNRVEESFASLNFDVHGERQSDPTSELISEVMVKVAESPTLLHAFQHLEEHRAATLDSILSADDDTVAELAHAIRVNADAHFAIAFAFGWVSAKADNAQVNATSEPGPEINLGDFGPGSIDPPVKFNGTRRKAGSASTR